MREGAYIIDVARGLRYDMGNRTEDLRLFRCDYVDGYACPAFRLLRNVNNINHLVRVRLKARGLIGENT